MTILDRDKLADKLKKSGYTVVEITEVTEKARVPEKVKTKEAAKGISLDISLGVSDDDLAFFTRQFATILNSGVPMDRILTLLYNQSKNRKMKTALYEIGADLQKGLSLSDAFRKHSKIFDEMFLSMVTVGETGGTLPNAMARMADLTERSLAIKKQIKSAMAYPIFILVFSMILCYVLVVFFLPGFIPMFSGLGLDLKKDFPLTAFLISASEVARNPSVIILTIIMVVAVFISLRTLIKNVPAFKLFMDSILFALPGFGNLVRQASFARFCRSFGSLSTSGVPVIKALDLVAGAAGNMVISSAIKRLSKQVQEGSSISQALQKDRTFPELLVQMVNVGEEAGSVPEMFEKTADYYDQSLDSAVSALTSLLEPLMMVFVGCIVGVFVLGILLPLMSITSKMGTT